jgi:hypothetical protein
VHGGWGKYDREDRGSVDTDQDDSFFRKTMMSDILHDLRKVMARDRRDRPQV